MWKGHWLDSPRVPGPRDCVQRGFSARHAYHVFHLLPSVAHRSVVGQGGPTTPTDLGAHRRTGDRHAGSGRATPSLRTPRRVTKSHYSWPDSGSFLVTLGQGVSTAATLKYSAGNTILPQETGVPGQWTSN